ncbi:MAG: hypothetical protein AABX03_02050, partial [Nanoarchaeota archaeon]
INMEANILANPENNEPEIGIQVSDHLFLGNVSKGSSTTYLVIQVNKTGSQKMNVRPELVDPDNSIFQNLYFKESSGSPKKIGEFNMNITASSKNLYVKLDLTDFNGNIDSDLIGEDADIILIAVSAD